MRHWHYRCVLVSVRVCSDEREEGSVGRYSTQRNDSTQREGGGGERVLGEEEECVWKRKQKTETDNAKNDGLYVRKTQSVCQRVLEGEAQ